MTTDRADVPPAVTGDRRCMFGSPEAFCGKPAALHVLFDGAQFTMGCNEHAGWWDYHAYEDMHAIGGACGLLGTTWMHATPERPSFCTVDGVDAAVPAADAFAAAVMERFRASEPRP